MSSFSLFACFQARESGLFEVQYSSRSFEEGGKREKEGDNMAASAKEPPVED